MSADRRSVEQARKQAKDLIKAFRSHDAAAAKRLRAALPQLHSAADVFECKVSLRDAQRTVAREHGFANWQQLLGGLEARPVVLQPGHPFAVALRRGDVREVRQLLEADPMLVDRRVRGDYLLTGEVWEDGKRATVGADDPRSSTGLQFAAFNGYAELTAVLIEFGAHVGDSGYSDAAETSAIVLAAWEGNVATLRVLLDVSRDADVRLSVDAALAKAAAHGARDKVELLLAHGAQHSIHTASMTGDVDAVRQLVLANPRVIDQVRSASGRTPLQEAVAHGHSVVADLLIEHGAAVQPEVAAARGDIDVIATLLERESAAVTSVFEGQPLLHWAVGGGQLAMMQLLLERGADVEGADQWGVSTLRAATQLQGGLAERAIGVLLRAGADVNRVSRGFSPLAAAVAGGHRESAQCLLDHGADVDARCYGGKTALHIALCHQQSADLEGCVALLLAAGADRSLRDDTGETPLELARRLGFDPAALGLTG